jgi:hypothetical protein
MKAKQLQQKIDNENQMLFDKLMKISRSPQFSYIGMQNSYFGKQKKILEAGFILRDQPSQNDYSSRTDQMGNSSLSKHSDFMGKGNHL